MKRPEKSRWAALFLSLALTLSALPVPARAALTGITLDATELEVERGRSVSLAAAVSADDDTLPSLISWESEDPSVAEVSGSTGASESAAVTGVAPGRTTVTASATDGVAGVSAACAVTVPGVKLDRGSLSLMAGDSAAVVAELYGAGVTAGTLTWVSSNPAAARVEGSGASASITAMDAGSAVITASAGPSGEYEAACTVVVTGNTAAPITADTAAGKPLAFSDGIAGTIANRCSVVLGGAPLQYASNISVPTKAGILYYNYRSESDPGAGVASAGKYYRSGDSGQLQLSEITFVPAADFSGTAVITYTGYDNSRRSFNGTVEVRIARNENITYTVSLGESVALGEDRFNDVCRIETGRDLDYVVFSLPSESRGGLYYNYVTADRYESAVEEGAKYYRSRAPQISRVSFVPGSYQGEVTLGYTGYSTGAGEAFRGSITIYVNNSKRPGSINYRTSSGKVTFSSGNFNDLSLDTTGRSLNYVKFSQPSSSQGTLYYDYAGFEDYDEKVNSSTRYYRNSSPRLSDVTFVAADGYSGTATVDFTGYDNYSESFSGSVSIQVGGSGGGGSDVVSYHTTARRAVRFDAGDFNAVCREINGESLDYVKFTQPSSSRGTLYYDYTSSGNYDSKIGSSTRYYRSGSPRLGDVSFVPAGGYTGTVEIDYVGYDNGGDSFSGVVEVRVGESGGSASLEYEGAGGEATALRVDDFNDYCRDETGRNLDYVRFTLPSKNSGILYYEYRGAKNTGSKVNGSTRYYRDSSPELDEVSFVPAEEYDGKVYLDFTGCDTAGETFSGTAVIDCETPAVAPIAYVSTGGPAVFRAGDFTTACRSYSGRDFQSVKFPTLPSSYYGTLYYDYASARENGGAVSASVGYRRTGAPTLSSVSFVPAAGVSGTVQIPYEGVDTSNRLYSGVVTVTVVPSAAASGFSDMAGYDWASPSVEYLRENGVVLGDASGRFNPGRNITRGDFILMLYRAFDLERYQVSGGGFSDVPAGSHYAQAVAVAQGLGIAQGNGGKFSPGDTLTRESGAVFLIRTMRVAGWSIGDGTRADLSSFADGGQVSGYAVGPMAAAVNLNLLQGSGNQLHPKNPLTRAQMAVILHRAMTM